MLGHVMEWFYAGLGGISQAEHSSAFKEIIFEPQLVSGLNEVKTSFNSPYGLIRSEWNRKGSTFHIEVEIPHNTTATLFLPTSERKSVKVNGKAPDKWIVCDQNKPENIGLKLGSGVFQVKSGIESEALISTRRIFPLMVLGNSLTN